MTLPLRPLLLGFLWILCASCNRNDLASGTMPKGGTDVDPPPPPHDDCPEDPPIDTYPVVINEVMYSNTKTLQDDTGAYPPWVELFNNSDVEADLSGVYLSDLLEEPKKWRIPCLPKVLIPARGFKIIYMDGLDRSDAGGIHAGFVLAYKSRQKLVLNRGSFFSPTSKPKADQSIGYLPDGDVQTDSVIFTGPSPGEANHEGGGDPNTGVFMRGDADRNGKVTVTDMSVIEEILSGGRALPTCQDRADVNDDGVVDRQDTAYLGNFLFTGGPSPPPPYPLSGLDPTPDDLPCPAE